MEDDRLIVDPIDESFCVMIFPHQVIQTPGSSLRQLLGLAPAETLHLVTSSVMICCVDSLNEYQFFS